MMSKPSPQEIEVSGPGGLKAHFRGSTTALIFTLIATTIGYGAWRGDVKAEERNQALMQKIKEQEVALRDLSQTQTIMIYVLSLPMAEREKLNLMQPKGLREMQR